MFEGFFVAAFYRFLIFSMSLITLRDLSIINAFQGITLCELHF